MGVWGQQPQSPPAPEQPPRTQAIRRNVDLVNVLFTVVNQRNKIVADLGQENFRVFDNNIPQEVRFFSRQGDLPLRVGLLLDTSNSIRQRIQFEQEAAVDFLFNLIRRDKDQAFLMDVDDDPEIVQDFTGDLDRLRDVIQQQRAGGGTALYDAVYQASEHLASQVPQQAGAPLEARSVLVVISDGESNEGSVWEAAMMAAHYRLDNLVAIVDRNGLQITGSTEDVCQLAPLDEKFEAFGFAVQRCNGNDIGELIRAFDAIPFRPGKPSLVLAKTRKGKGVSFMENVAKWHHGVPSDDELSRAMAELEAAEAVLA